MKLHTVVERLGRTALFGGVRPGLLENLAASASIVELEKNEIVFLEDDPVQAMYIVDEGSVRLFKTSLQGKEHVLHFVEQGESFAEAALFGFSGYPATAQTTTGTRLIRLPKESFLAALDDDADFRNALFRGMAMWLRRFADIIQSLTFKDVESRLASYLLAQCRQYCEPCEDGSSFELGIGKSMLASYLGTIPETLSRALRKMQDAGCITVNRSRITIENIRALREIVSED